MSDVMRDSKSQSALPQPLICDVIISSTVDPFDWIHEYFKSAVRPGDKEGLMAPAARIKRHRSIPESPKEAHPVEIAGRLLAYDQSAYFVCQSDCYMFAGYGRE